jgi:hypothetical protein
MSVDNADDYEQILRKLKPGEQVKVRILRIEWTEENGRKVPKEVEREVSVTVGGA